MTVSRCPWSYAGINDAYIRYHDDEWGWPVHDEQTQFEFLILEGAQAGLSWATILKKREGYREAFAGFDASKIAEYSAADVERLMQFPGIVRNRLKIESAINNARRILELREQCDGFNNYLWSFVDGRPQVNRWATMDEVPSTSSVSDAISKDLRKRGFKFVGSTIIYAHMQATGLVNDHLVSCFRHEQCALKAPRRE